jgi:hypothetical protein
MTQREGGTGGRTKGRLISSAEFIEDGVGHVPPGLELVPLPALQTQGEPADRGLDPIPVGVVPSWRRAR